MGQNDYNKNYTKKSTSKNPKTVNIEEIIDRILSENNKKSDISSKKQLDLEKISLRNKKGNTIYYLRKRLKNIEELDETEETDNEYNNLKKNNDQLNSKESDIILSNIEKELDKIQLEMTNNNKKIVLKEFIDKSKTDKKPGLFFKNKKFKDEERQDLGKIPTSTDVLDELKKQESKEITPIKVTTEKEKIVNVEDLIKTKRKKPFFEPEKSSEEKSKDVKQKTPIAKKISFTDEIDKRFLKLQQNKEQDVKPIKKFRMFFKNEKSKDENKKEGNWFSYDVDDLIKLKEQESKKISSVKVPDKKVGIIKEEKQVEEDFVVGSKKRRPFFKSKKISDAKAKVVKEEALLVEKVSFDDEFDKIFVESKKKGRSDVKAVGVGSEVKPVGIVEEHVEDKLVVGTVDEKPVKKPRLFFRHKKLKEEKEEDSDWFSSITDDLVESRHTASEKILPTKVPSKKVGIIKEEKQVEEDFVVGSKKRRPFFKSKKISDAKAKVVEKEALLVEKVSFYDEFDKIFVESKKKGKSDVKAVGVGSEVKPVGIVEEHVEDKLVVGTVDEKPVKKPRLFFRHKKVKENKDLDFDWSSLNTDDFVELRERGIKKKFPVNIYDEKEKIKVDKDLDKPKKKRLFLKSKKTSKAKSELVDEKTPIIEGIDIKPSFNVEKKSFGDELEKDEAKLVDKKIVESKVRLDETPLKAELEIKANKLAYEHLKTEPVVTSFDEKPVKKPRLFFRHKKVKENKEEDSGWRPEITKDLDEYKDHEIKTLLPGMITDEKEKIKVYKDLDKPKKKRLFFKSKKTSKAKSELVDEKTPIIEGIDIKPSFNVEKISFGDELEKDEAKLVDKKIVESKERPDGIPLKAELEIKANKLAEEHLKKSSSKTSFKKEFDKKLAPNLNVDIPTDSKGLVQEHVFFNEEDTPQYGWSPQIVEKEKSKEPDEITSEGEIGLGNLEKINDIELPRDILSTNSVKLTELGFSENEWEELEFYALFEPFAYVEILRQKDTLDKCYFLVEIALTDEEKNILAFLKDTLNSLNIDAEEMENRGDNEYLYYTINQIIKEYSVKINDESKKKLFYFIGKSSLGLGKINPLMKDPNIEDISCDGARVPVFLYHRKYGSLKSNVRFENEDELSSFIFKLAQKCGKHISIAEPMLDATMPDGSRIQMTLSDEITAKGSTFTIRKFRSEPFSPTDLIEFNTMSSEMIAYMWIAVENGINTLFAGGTASGKTTTLNAVMLFIPRESKIVSIEETREINLPHPNWIPGVSRTGFGEIVADKAVGEIDTYDLMKAALRQRPEYIIVGEIRGKEAYVLFQAMATGHATYSTAHADSAQSLIHRLEGKPINIPRIMLQSLDLVCIHVITRVKNMRARRCKQIIEIIDIDPTTKEILTNEVFHWDPVEDKFVYSGKSYILERIRTEKDLTKEEMNQEIANRKKIIDWMNANNIRGFKDVANVVTKYTETPDEFLEKIGKVDK